MQRLEAKNALARGDVDGAIRHAKLNKDYALLDSLVMARDASMLERQSLLSAVLVCM